MTGTMTRAAHLRDTGDTIAEIIAKTGIPHTSLYRHLPPRAAPLLSAAEDASTRAPSTRSGYATAANAR